MLPENESIDQPESRWGLPPGSSFLWREWDPEEAVVYDRGSNGTHLLDAFSAATLRTVAERPATVQELAKDLSDRSGADVIEVRQRLGAVLDALKRLGLIEAVAHADR